MKNLKFEKITPERLISDDLNTAKFVFKPLSRGFGTTLGNSLRRVLLSSIPGANLVNIEIDDVRHEFATIDGVYEDVVGIILNLKELIFKVEEEDPNYEAILEIDVTDKDVVTAADFRLPAGVEVVNKDLVICRLSEGKRFHMLATLKLGVGYVSNVDNRVTCKHAGQIAIDSIFNPVKRVTFRVEKLQGDKDELILEVETNGAIQANDAVAIASEMLIEHLEQIKLVSEKEVKKEYFQVEDVVEEKTDLDLSIHDLNLPVRVFNALSKKGYKTVSQLIQKTQKELKETVRGLGSNSIERLEEILEEHGFKLRQPEDDFEGEE